MLSVIVPTFNEELIIKKTTIVIDNILTSEKIEHELLFVDDGSIDKTWDIILARKLQLWQV